MRGAWFSVSIVVGILIAWYAVSIGNFTSTNNVALVVSLMPIALVSLSPLLYYLRRNPANVANPISVLGLSYLLYAVFGAFGAIWNPGALVVGEPGLRFLPFATFLLMLGFLFFGLGYFLLPTQAQQNVDTFQWKENRIPLAVLILAGVAWGTRYYGASQGLVLPKLISDEYGGISAIDIVGSNPLVLSLAQRSHVLSWAAILICLVACKRVYAHQPAYRRNRWLLTAMVLLALEWGYWITIGLAKMPIIGVSLSVFCLVSMVRKPPLKQALIFMVLFVFFVVPVMQTAKNLGGIYGLTEIASRDVSKLGLFVQQVFPQAVELIVADYSNSYIASLNHATRLTGADLMILVAEKQVGEDQPPIGVWPLLMTLLGLVPRAIWPDKPLSFGGGREIQNYYRYGYGDSYRDAVLTPVVELYAYVGALGVALGMFLYGVLVRIVYRVLVERNGRTWNTGLVLYAVLAFELLVQENTLSGVMAPLRDVLILWIFLAIVLEGRIPLLHRQRVHRRWILAKVDSPGCGV